MVKESSVEESETPSIQIIYEPSQVWSQHVIPLVLDKFTVDLVDTRIDSSMFATIPRIISSTNEGSPVYSVCNAVACAYLATTTGATAATVNRAKAYGTALKTVSAALNDPVECKSDSTLLAIWMFVVYEGLRRGTATVEEWHLWLDFEARSNSLGKMDGILSCLSAIAL
ncbi:hypothetical protein N7504_005136 [Penicillium tannophilum]|nr:hypothetical protein N7504_005136 [Penicillium tannophilum]